MRKEGDTVAKEAYAKKRFFSTKSAFSRKAIETFLTFFYEKAEKNLHKQLW